MPPKRNNNGKYTYKKIYKLTSSQEIQVLKNRPYFTFSEHFLSVTHSLLI